MNLKCFAQLDMTSLGVRILKLGLRLSDADKVTSVRMRAMIHTSAGLAYSLVMLASSNTS